MGFATYTELKSAVENWLDRDDRDSEIQDWVRLTELEVERQLELGSQQGETTGTLTGGVEYIETPAGIIYPQQLIFDTEPPRIVNVVPLSQGEEIGYAQRGDAAPERASVWGVNPSTFATRIRVWPVPQSDVAYTLYYVDRITPLTAASPTNYLLLIAPDIYLYGCRMHSDLFDENPEGAVAWRQLLDGQIRSVKKQQKWLRAKAGRLRMRPRRGTTP